MTDGEKNNPNRQSGKLTALIVSGSVCLGLILLYLGMCFWVAFSGRLLPNSKCMSIEVGNMTYETANAAIRQAFDSFYTDESIELYQSDTDTAVTIPLEIMTLSVDETKGSFLSGGAALLQSIFSAADVSPVVTLSSASETYLQSMIEEFAAACNQALSQSSIDITDTELIIEKGFSGYQVDEAATAEAVLSLMEEAVNAVNTNQTVPLSLEAVYSETVPVSPDFDLLYDQIYTEPQSAALNKETFEITPSVTGVSFDVDEAQKTYEQLSDGGTCTIPLILTEPAITTEQLEEKLFHDALGSVRTYVGGVANRVSNVKTAAKYCNEIVLLPGDTFSYNSTVSPFTEANGYLPAPAYVAGETVDEMAGGICQVSSSIYYAALKANLEIVERHQHMYAVGYVPDGTDATVYSNSLDFQFKNNTEYPIKIVTSMSNRYLTVTLYGTKTDSNYVVMEGVRTSTTNYEVIYVPDETVPEGTTVEEVTPYTGRTVEVYRNVYSADGTLLSSTLESVNTYKKRDQVIHYNPTDAASLGLAESTEASATDPSGSDSAEETPTVPDSPETGATVTEPSAAESSGAASPDTGTTGSTDTDTSQTQDSMKNDSNSANASQASVTAP